MEQEPGESGNWWHERFDLEALPPLVVRSLGDTDIIVTEVKFRTAPEGLMTPIPESDGFLMTVHFDICPPYEVWENGKRILTPTLAAGVTNIYDLRTAPVAAVKEKFHQVSFDMPRAALDAIADAEEIPRIEDFVFDWRTGYHDPVLSNLALLLKPAFSNKSEVNRLISDHVTMAAAAHSLKAYGNVGPPRTPAPITALSPFQKAIACDLLRANLDGNLTLHDLGRACGLPALVFARAFRRTTGMHPHQWLMAGRMTLARDILLRRPFLPLGSVADICGFTSTRHLIRVFKATLQAHPEDWRHQH